MTLAKGAVFLDSGYLLALELRTDDYHGRALSHWRDEKRREPASLVTTTYVFNEVVTYLNARGLHASAVKVGRRLRESPSIDLVGVSDDLFERGFSLFVSRPDKRYSLTDCVSFALMWERDLAVAYSFDRHFEQEGFVREPRGE